VHLLSAIVLQWGYVTFKFQRNLRATLLEQD
jgi:hypothetical protein